MAEQQDVLDFAHVALLWNLATGPKNALYFCPDGNRRVLPVIVSVADDLRGMGLVSIAGESSETMEFSLTGLGEKAALELVRGTSGGRSA
jgi:hypothetical protein